MLLEGIQLANLYFHCSCSVCTTLSLVILIFGSWYFVSTTMSMDSFIFIFLSFFCTIVSFSIFIYGSCSSFFIIVPFVNSIHGFWSSIWTTMPSIYFFRRGIFSWTHGEGIFMMLMGRQSISWDYKFNLSKLSFFYELICLDFNFVLYLSFLFI